MMVDLNILDAGKALEFLKSREFETARDFLFLENLSGPEISCVSMKEGTVMAHRLIALEYARWLDYAKFGRWALDKVG